MQTKPIQIGTRGSALALVQANDVRDRLIDAHGLDPKHVVVKIIKTTGDMIADRPLSEVGGKGLFTKEIEEQLLSGVIDIAVHSSKDMPSILPDGLVLDTFLPREDPRDAFVSPIANTVEELPQNAIIGSASLRRQAQLKRLRPDFQTILFRGNVGTRLEKLKQGQAHATLLAVAGLNRLDQSDTITQALPVTHFLPAPAQGAVGIERRINDDRISNLLHPLHHAKTAACVEAERAFLNALDGSCRMPIAALCEQDTKGELTLKGEVLRPDGTEFFFCTQSGSIENRIALGHEAGTKLKEQLSEDFWVSLHSSP